MKRICTVNELFLLRLMPPNGSNEKSAPSHSIVISLNNAASPSKAAQLSTLGVEPNPFYVSIVHPRPCRSLHLCCASIGPVNSFRPDILRAALRVFVPQGCRTGTWTKAVSWFWKTLEASKGKKPTKGKQWIETRGLQFWTSLREELMRTLHEGDGRTLDFHLGRKILLDLVDDLLRRNHLPFQPRRHVLHTARIIDPGTLAPAFDTENDDGYRLLCGLEPLVADDDRAMVRCYDRLFDAKAPLLHEPITSSDEMAWKRLVDLRIARQHDMCHRTFYYSPYRIIPTLVDALCQSPRPVIDCPIPERPLDHLARLFSYPVEEYLLVYDSSITPDSPTRRLLLAQFKNTPQDLATVEMISVGSASTENATQRIRRVVSSVYRKTAKTTPFETRCVKTVFLLDFAIWRLQQLLRLFECFTISRIMSKAHSAWVALNVTTPPIPMGENTTSTILDPKEWTQDATLASVFAWFDANFIKQ